VFRGGESDHATLLMVIVITSSGGDGRSLTEKAEETVLEFPEFRVRQQQAVMKIVFEFKTVEAYQKYRSVLLEALWFGPKEEEG
jgi:hypothetical protein